MYSKFIMHGQKNIKFYITLSEALFEISVPLIIHVIKLNSGHTISYMLGIITI